MNHIRSENSQNIVARALSKLQRFTRLMVILARHRRATPWLVGLTTAESVVFPIPVDPMLAAMVAARPRRAFRYALVCTTASVVGGALGYLIGSGLLGPVINLLVDGLGQSENYQLIVEQLEQNGAMWVFIAGFTPFPYKIVTLGSGAVGINFGLFILMSILSRGLRYFLVAGIIKFLGPIGRIWIQRHFGKLTIAICVAIVAIISVYAIL